MYHAVAASLGVLAGFCTLTGGAILIYRRRTVGPVFSATTRYDKAMFALPLGGIQLGTADQGSNAKGSSTRIAYDLLADGFGPGINGPLVLAVRLDKPGDRTALQQLTATLRQEPDVAAVSEPVLSPTANSAIFQVIPRTSPQDTRTTDLLRHVRNDLVPASGLTAHVGGPTAVFDDFAGVIKSKLLLFVSIVVGLSFVLLLLAFRSLVIPLVVQ